MPLEDNYGAPFPWADSKYKRNLGEARSDECQVKMKLGAFEDDVLLLYPNKQLWAIQSATGSPGGSTSLYVCNMKSELVDFAPVKLKVRKYLKIKKSRK